MDRQRTYLVDMELNLATIYYRVAFGYFKKNRRNPKAKGLNMSPNAMQKLIISIQVLVLSMFLVACGSSIQMVEQKQAKTIVDNKKVKPIAIAKVVSKIRRGTKIGKIQGGVFCVNQSDLTWENRGTVNIGSEELVDVFRDELERNGWPVVGSTDDLFSGYDVSAAELLVAAKIIELNADVCMPMLGFGNTNSKGKISMKVEWQIFNPSIRDVVGTVTTLGSAETTSSVPYGSDELMAQGFALAVNNLLANNEFWSLVDKSARFIKPDFSTLTSIKNDLKRFPSVKEALTEAQKSTVVIRTATSHGSAFAIGDGTNFLTNAHVVGDAENVTLVLGGAFEISGAVLKKDKARDIALVRIDQGRVPPLHLELSAPSVTEEIFAIGAPLDEALTGTVTRGVVSSVRTLDGLNYIQGDVAVSPGNSGGPLLNSNGSVVGVTAAGLMPGGGQVGLNLFIPISDALEFLGLSVQPQTAF